MPEIELGIHCFLWTAPTLKESHQEAFGCRQCQLAESCNAANALMINVRFGQSLTTRRTELSVDAAMHPMTAKSPH